MRQVRWLGICSLAAVLAGCAGDYVAKTRGVRQAYQSYDYDRALNGLNPKEAADIDKLLVLLDRGMVLHAAGRFEESIQVLAEADRLSQQLDYTSLSEQAATMLSNERESVYRGEDFEKLMISVLLALNYAELNKDEDALVEIRRVNERIRKMISDEKKPYEQLAIARYLGGVLYEDQGEEDSAFIDYYDAYRLNPRMGTATEAVLRLAKQTGRDDIYRELKAKYPQLDDSPIRKDESQIVVVIEAGLVAEKEATSKNFDGSASPQLIPIPVFRDRGSVRSARVKVGQNVQKAVPITSVSTVAKAHLNDRVGRMVAKQLAAQVLKAGIAAGVGTLAKDSTVGALTFLLLNVNNVPDLRSWLSLPAEFQVARFRVAPGRHTVTVDDVGKPAQYDVDAKPGRIRLLVLRRY